MSQPASLFRSSSSTLFALTLIAGIARADVGDQISKVVAPYVHYFDHFGNSVALSGSTAIVGVAWDDAGGENTGSAYLFDVSTATVAQTAWFRADDGQNYDQFGSSIGVSGTTAIIGAQLDDDNGVDSGSAYLFDTTSGLQLAKLLATDGEAGDWFGVSVGISGATAIVGAFWDDDNGNYSGSAYLFDTLTGSQTAKLLPADGQPVDWFGRSVAISGSIAIVGSENGEHNGIRTGAVYLFDAGTGQELFKLVASDGVQSDRFGIAVAISGTVAIVGASSHDANGTDSGTAYLFDTRTGLQIAKLLPDSGSAYDHFGAAVDISGTTTIVGAFTNSDMGGLAGAAYLFDTSTGLLLTPMYAADGVGQDYFGEAVAISGAKALVSAPGFSGDDIDEGTAYLFEGVTVPAMTGDVASLSLVAGGRQLLTLSAGAARAGWFYWVLGSASGTAPGLDFGGGVVLPLNYDAYFQFTLNKPFAGFFINYIGVLNANGAALAANTLPAGTDPSLAGLTLNHAFLATPNFPGANAASNAVSVQLAQ